MAEFEFLKPTDKPAIIGVSTPEYVSICRSTLHELDYKVHSSPDHEDFVVRFAQVQYHIAILEERFGCESIIENHALARLQFMPMTQRRHAVTLLIGESFQSLNTMQAYNQSVHAVLNPVDLGSLKQVLQQMVSENDLFLSVYRDTQTRMAQGKI
jgi:hypothetical protein